jgi:hypothetical protein
MTTDQLNRETEAIEAETRETVRQSAEHSSAVLEHKAAENTLQAAKDSVRSVQGSLPAVQPSEAMKPATAPPSSSGEQVKEAGGQQALPTVPDPIQAMIHAGETPRMPVPAAVPLIQEHPVVTEYLRQWGK